MFKRRLLLSLIALAGLAAFAFTLLTHPSATAVESVASSQASSIKAQPSESEDSFIVHEWGTFTTFSGSDGVFLEFRPLANELHDLPGFVLNRATASKSPMEMMISKAKIRGRVRMETPVTYFYTDRIREVNVRVGFPDGLLTEFYPPVRKMLPKFDNKVAFQEGEPLGDSVLDWGKVTLIPTSEIIPGFPESAQRQQVSEAFASAVLPIAHWNHYAQARETDSAIVHFVTVHGSVQ